MSNLNTTQPRTLTAADAKHTATRALFALDPALHAWIDQHGGLGFESEIIGEAYYADPAGWTTAYGRAIVAARMGVTEYDQEKHWDFDRLSLVAAVEVVRKEKDDVEKTLSGRDEADKAYAETARRRNARLEASKGNAVANDGNAPIEHEAAAGNQRDDGAPRASSNRNAPSLRDYQQRGIEQLGRAIRQGVKRILLVGPTGMGKMVLAGHLMHACEAKRNPSMFIADQRELVDQCHDKLQKYGVDCSIIMAQSDQWSEDAIAFIASKDTLHARAVRNSTISIPNVKLVIADEAHKSLAPTWIAVLQHCVDRGAISVGMTATPVRLDGRGLGDNYDKLIQIATYKELRDAGWIVPCKVYAPTNPDLRGVQVARGDYVKAQLAGKMDTQKLVGDVVKDWRKRADGRQTFCFASGVHHSVHLRNQFRKHGISAEHIDSKHVSSVERDEIMGRFKRGEITVLCNYGIATTGVDVPEASCVISCRPTKSFSLWRQMCGRGLRSAPGKNDLIVLDHSGAVFVHGFPDEDVDWVLSTTETIHDRIKEKREQEQKAGKEPYECPGCQAVYRGPECPECGHKKELRSRGVEMEKGELNEVDREKIKAKLNEKTPKEDKQKDWKKFMGVAMQRNSTMKMALAMYKSKYGVMPPPGLDFMPKGGGQWALPAKEFYQRYQDQKLLGKGMNSGN